MKTTVLYSSDWTASVCNFLTLPSIGCPSNRLGKSASSLVPVTISEHLTGKLLLRHFSHVRQKWRCYCEVKLIKEECPLIVPVCLSVCVFCSRLSIKVNVCTTGDDGDGGANRCNHKRREKMRRESWGGGKWALRWWWWPWWPQSHTACTWNCLRVWFMGELVAYVVTELSSVRSWGDLSRLCVLLCVWPFAAHFGHHAALSLPLYGGLLRW